VSPILGFTEEYLEGS